MEGNRIYRLHLRIEKSGNGVLSINATKILHLNQTATEMAKCIIDGMDNKAAIKHLVKRYKISSSTLQKDFDNFKTTIETLSRAEDTCPVTSMNIDLVEPIDESISAPYRMDLALTYACDNNCNHCYIERPQKGKPLTTNQWKDVIRKCKDIGIPHICFTGGEPTLYKDLVELVTYAEDLELVTGLLTNGRNLKDEKLVTALVGAGIDHFQITLESHVEDIHNKMMGTKTGWAETVQGIKNAVKTPVYTITNTTLCIHNADTMTDTVKFIKSLGLDAFACNSIIFSGDAKKAGIGISEKKLEDVLQKITLKAEELNLKFIWYSPTQYCSFNPVEHGLGMKQCSAARYNMCIEPDGEVLPCQSFYHSVGNFLNDTWENIWNHELCKKLRSHEWVPDKCKDCGDFFVCGGGCPLNIQTDQPQCILSKYFK
ncbi:MAG: hypothetical protein A2161_07440 [Candidatus Schekmanbacteria bacterium RBG_13_48_7]|uniref:Radical SAM core domain-containing protein n=1 Tax=Candidatus Schekmanbacteria bacterium RBG_13_48_7 TaxID=1817878 RepID=A0A1F7RMV3_9BACT|nr:MAG: hypothetical protein A2161_07440 [Candidatus Schekmanbacteria bacterium RBG_13_48_7]